MNFFEFLLVSHSCDSDDVSYVDIETTVSRNQSREMLCDLFLLNLPDASYIGFHSKFLRIL